MIKRLKHIAFIALVGGGAVTLSGCEPVDGVYVSGGVYYDGLLWNDYYRPRPPVVKPPHPPRPTPPIARPPRPTPPIHRPPRPPRPTPF